MYWSCLGHAGWLIEVAGLRLLVDPLLGPAHHRGVFTVTPSRTLEDTALRPDYLLISHAHPDHFDVPSLRRLAQLDPDTVVMTPDPLVGWAAGRLGFRSVQLVAPGSLVTLDGPRLLTTPSAADDEWGLLVEHEGATALHLIDTVLDARGATRLRAQAAEALGQPALLARGPDLSLVLFQPLLEVAQALGDPQRFPMDAYGRTLSLVQALGQTTVVPSSASSVHAPRYAAMNGLVYPQTETRFLRDVASLGLPSLPGVLGGRYRVSPGSVELDRDGARSLIRDAGTPVDVSFRPFAPAPLCDPNPRHYPLATMKDAIDRWVVGPLAAALATSLGPIARRLSLSLEVVYPASPSHPAPSDAYSLLVDGGAVRVVRALDPDHDQLNAVAASSLWDVIEGRASWGDALLAGELRASSRAYEVTPAGLQPLGLGPFFLYHALSYDQSVRRAVEHELS